MGPGELRSPRRSSADIQHKYNMFMFAPWYDLATGLPERLGVKRLRRTLLQRATGQVLEVAVGTGTNLPYYPKPCHLTAVDVSPAMLDRARQRATRLGVSARFQVMDAEQLAFPEQHFDTVVETLALCTFPEPVAALRDMARVCKPAGRLLLLEHGRSDRAWLGAWQDRRAARHATKLGCWWNREPLALVQQAGLRVIAAGRRFFGVFHLMEVGPPPAAPAPGGEDTATSMEEFEGDRHAP